MSPAPLSIKGEVIKTFVGGGGGGESTLRRNKLMVDYQEQSFSSQ